MEKLLNVVDNTLFEVSRISEQANPRDRFVDERLITGADGLNDVTHQKPANAIAFDVGNRALLFQPPSGHVAEPAIRDTVASQDVAPAEDLMADDAEPAPVCECQEITALGTSTGSVTLPHGRFSMTASVVDIKPIDLLLRMLNRAVAGSVEFRIKKTCSALDHRGGINPGTLPSSP